MISSEECPIKINVFMSFTFKNKIDWLSKNYDKEIGGFILGVINTDGVFMEDLLIPKQEVSSASVDFDKKDLIDMRVNNEEKCQRIIGEWHSHNDMEAYWSATDEELISQFCEGRDISMFIVSNINKHIIRLEMRNPIKLSLNKLSFAVYGNPIDEEMKKELEDKIKIKKEIKVNKFAPTNLKDFMNDKNVESIADYDNNVYGRNVMRKNKIVKVFGINEITRQAVMEAFESYTPKLVQNKDVLFILDDINDAIEFYMEVCDFVFMFKKRVEKDMKDDGEEVDLEEESELSSIEEIQEDFDYYRR